MKTLFKTTFILFILLITSCSDDSSNNDTQAEAQKGIMNVSGAIDAQHEGVTWYDGLQADQDNMYFNYKIHISDVLPTDEEDYSYSLLIRFMPVDGPFLVEEGEYVIGDTSNVVQVNCVYQNKSESTLKSYGISPGNEGIITIESISDNNIKASFDLKLYNSPNTEDGFIIVEGNLSADCFNGFSFGC